MAEVKTLDELFLDTLKDVYFAENKIIETLPKMHEAAKSVELKDAFTKHLAETKVHVERLVQVFEIIGEDPEQKTCDAISRDHRRRCRDHERVSGLAGS